jgi:hypothetical protein
MTSQRKIAANRRNSQKSCGPRSAAGKAIASRNALRHGLAAIPHVHPELSPEIGRFARAICGGDTDPLLFEQALVIASNEDVLRTIQAQRIAVIERLRDINPIALAKGDNSLAVAKVIASPLDGPELAEYESLREKCLQPLPEKSAEELEWTNDLEAAGKAFEERDESEAVEEGAPDLVRLERYYRRVWSRQNRAIRDLMNIKLMRAMRNGNFG